MSHHCLHQPGSFSRQLRVAVMQTASMQIAAICAALIICASPSFAQEALKDSASEDSAAEQPMDAAQAAPVMPEHPPMPEMPAEPAEVAGMMDPPTHEAHLKVFNAFRARLPGVPVESLMEGPFPGWYEVVTDGQVIYVDETVEMLFQGEMIDLNRGINLTEARRTGLHMGLINDMGEENMLVYKSDTPSDRSITVFTDINCGYCRKLHAELDTLLEGGVNVRYLMFPRAGLESDSRTALESVWCADNPQEAMTSAKAGQPIEPLSCDSPMEKHYALAEQVGLRGTPLIYLDNGTVIPGYREAKVLVEMVNSTEPYTN